MSVMLFTPGTKSERGKRSPGAAVLCADPSSSAAQSLMQDHLIKPELPSEPALLTIFEPTSPHTPPQEVRGWLERHQPTPDARYVRENVNHEETVKIAQLAQMQIFHFLLLGRKKPKQQTPINSVSL